MFFGLGWRRGCRGRVRRILWRRGRDERHDRAGEGYDSYRASHGSDRASLAGASGVRPVLLR
jgi:hypothetical protein